MLPLPHSPAPRHCQSTTHQKYLICPLCTSLLRASSLSFPTLILFLLRRVMSYSSSSGTHPGLSDDCGGHTVCSNQGEGQTKSQGGSWRAGHAPANLRMQAVWWLAMPLIGHSPGFRRSSSKTCSPASVKKERTTAGLTQVSGQLPVTPGNIKLSAAPAL